MKSILNSRQREVRQAATRGPSEKSPKPDRGAKKGAPNLRPRELEQGLPRIAPAVSAGSDTSQPDEREPILFPPTTMSTICGEQVKARRGQVQEITRIRHSARVSHFYSPEVTQGGNRI